MDTKTEQIIRQRFRYDGTCLYKTRSRREAGTITSQNELIVQVKGEQIPAQNIIIFLHTGQWPRYKVVHRNSNVLDNRLKNLVELTPSGPREPKRRAERDTYREPDGHPKPKKFAAVLRVDGKRIHCGYYSDQKEAKRVADEAKKKYLAGHKVGRVITAPWLKLGKVDT